MTLNGVVTIILRYLNELLDFWANYAALEVGRYGILALPTSTPNIYR